MADMDSRGSEKLLEAWKGRALTDESVQEIADALGKSSGKVERAMILGGADATGARISLAYTGEDTPICGNDIAFWVKWHLRHGGTPRPPKIIIDGIPFPEIIRLELDFGNVLANEPLEMPVAGLNFGV